MTIHSNSCLYNTHCSTLLCKHFFLTNMIKVSVQRRKEGKKFFLHTSTNLASKATMAQRWIFANLPSYHSLRVVDLIITLDFLDIKMIVYPCFLSYLILLFHCKFSNYMHLCEFPYVQLSDLCLMFF